MTAVAVGAIPSMTMTTLATSGVNPVTVGTFPGSSPYELKSATGGLSLKGDGSGSVGTGTFRDSVRTAVGGRMTFGSFTGNTDASGDITITHGLGTTPTSVAWTPSQLGGYRTGGAVAAPTSTVFKVRCYTTAGVLEAAGVSKVGYWQAFV
jgi:hypothetical protein